MRVTSFGSPRWDVESAMDIQVWPSLPCRIKVAGSEVSPYTSRTIIWQSHASAPWLGQQQLCKPSRAVFKLNVCTPDNPAPDKWVWVICKAWSHEKSIDKKGERVVISRLGWTWHHCMFFPPSYREQPDVFWGKPFCLFFAYTWVITVQELKLYV